MKDSRPVQALSVHQAGTGGGGEGDDDDDDIEDLTGVTDFCLLNLKYLFLEISFQWLLNSSILNQSLLKAAIIKGEICSSS